MFSPNFEIQLIFLHYLRSKALSRLQLLRQFVYKVYYYIAVMFHFTCGELHLYTCGALQQNYPLIRKVNKLQKSPSNHLTFSRMWVTDTIFQNMKIYQISAWQRKDDFHVALHHFYVKETTESTLEIPQCICLFLSLAMLR